MDVSNTQIHQSRQMDAPEIRPSGLYDVDEPEIPLPWGAILDDSFGHNMLSSDLGLEDQGADLLHDGTLVNSYNSYEHDGSANELYGLEHLLSSSSDVPGAFGEFTTQQFSYSGYGNGQVPESIIEEPLAGRTKARRRSGTVLSVRPNAVANDKTPSHHKEGEDVDDSLVRRSSPVSQKKRSALKRNCGAAKKSRNKRKTATMSLSEKEREMTELNSSLAQEAKNLASQVCELKMKVLEHGGCECQLIQHYIDCEANRFAKQITDQLATDNAVLKIRPTASPASDLSSSSSLYSWAGL